MSVGIVLYNSDKYQVTPYLTPFFQTLVEQDYPSFEIYVLDNGSPDPRYLIHLQKKFPTLRIIQGKDNRGFGAGHNLLIHKTSSPYYLVLNPDVLLESNCITHMVDTMQKDNHIGVVSGKVYQWDFGTYRQSNGQNVGKTNIIDTIGLGLTRCHRFYDRGQGEEDKGQYETFMHVFGVSGVCMLLRRDALKTICCGKEYFDEDMFLYKEDIDLCYRLQWAGYHARIAHDAILYHDRHVGISTTKSVEIKRMSYQNEKIVLLKNIDRRFPCIVRWCTALRQFVKTIWLYLSDPTVVRHNRIPDLLQMRIQEKKNRMIKNVSPHTIISLMS